MPEFPKPPRRQLKMTPTADEQFDRLVRSLERIADGFANIVETLDAVVTMTKDRESAIRTVGE